MYTSVSENEIIIGSPQELIYLSMKSMLGPRSVVVSVFPAYQSLYSVAQSLGCEVHYWMPQINSAGSLTYDISTLEMLMSTYSPDLVVINVCIYTFTYVLKGLGVSSNHGILHYLHVSDFMFASCSFPTTRQDHYCRRTSSLRLWGYARRWEVTYFQMRCIDCWREMH